VIYVIIGLAFVDVAALSIGISIRHKVTRIVGQTAAEIEQSVKAGIAEAVERLVGLVSAVLASGTSQPGELTERLGDVLSELKR